MSGSIDRSPTAIGTPVRSGAPLLTHTPSPIYHLPDEILIEIFLAFRSRCVDEMEYSHFENRAHSYEYVRVAHVCRLWRNVALATASLWSHISTSKDEGYLSDALLARSKGWPLTVDVRSSRVLSASEYLRHWILGNLMRHVNRIHDLRLTMGLVGWDVAMELLQRAHSLRSLTLLLSYGHPRPSDMGPFVLKGLKHINFCGSFHTLKVLPITEALSKTLTSLTLSEMSFSNSINAWPTGTFLSMLKHLPLLTVLRLRYLHLDFESSEESVALPALQELFLKFTNLPRCIWVMDHLSFPASIRLEIDQDTPQVSLLHDPLLELCLRKLSSKPNDGDLQNQYSGLRRLEIKLLQYDGCRIVGWDNVDDPSQFHPVQYQIPHRETARFDYFQRWRSALVEPTLSPQPHLLDIQVLRINNVFLRLTSVPPDRSDGFYMILAMRNLRTLCLDNWAEDDITVLISGSAQDILQSHRCKENAPHGHHRVHHHRKPRELDSSDMPFPMLSAMYLFNLMPSNPNDTIQQTGENEFVCSSFCPPWWNLQEALRDRRTALGSKLSRLDIEILDRYTDRFSTDRLDEIRSSVEELTLATVPDPI